MFCPYFKPTSHVKLYLNYKKVDDNLYTILVQQHPCVSFKFALFFVL